MRQSLGFFLLLTLCNLCTQPASAQQNHEWSEVAPGVHAVLQPGAQRFDDSNSVVLIGDEDVLVVDAQASADQVRALLAKLREMTNNPVRALVNTHWHGDHTQGNSLYVEAFGEQLEIVAHTSVLEDIPGRAKPALDEQIDTWQEAIEAAEERLKAGVDEEGAPMNKEEKKDLERRLERSRKRVDDWRQQRWALPTRTFGDRLLLQQGSRTIELLHLPGHTRGDVVLFLPAEKVLVTGDLLDDLPYGGHGYPRQWIRSLRRLRELDFDTIIPGHGAVRRGREHLDLVLAMFESIVGQVDAAIENGDDLETTKQKVNLETFRQQLAGDDASATSAFESFIPATIERAYLEAKGELPD
ncbi:MAG: MBL fold metallo-hydrolase [Candidatus Latescibacterota bacterium]|nr:MAG: MBL fold metallo-hydrolase [Candidatus Latescibacterota bacterium]